MKTTVTSTSIHSDHTGEWGQLFTDTKHDPLPDGTVPPGILTSTLYMTVDQIKQFKPGDEIEFMPGVANRSIPFSGTITGIHIYGVEMGALIYVKDSKSIGPYHCHSIRVPYGDTKFLVPEEEVTFSIVKK